MSIETRLLDWTKEGLIGADDARAFLALEEMRMAAAEIERLRGCIVKMQVAAQISDWETFDTVYREALGE